MACLPRCALQCKHGCCYTLSYLVEIQYLLLFMTAHRHEIRTQSRSDHSEASRRDAS